MSADIILYRLADTEVQPKWINIPNNEYEILDINNVVDLTQCKLWYGNRRGWKRVRNKFDKLPIRYGHIEAGNIHKYIIANTVFWYSSYHVLNARWYKKSIWLNLCITKEEVVRFFERYGNKRFDNYKDLMKDILEKWDDKSFLIISW